MKSIPEDNNFDLLRLILAVVVVLVHISLLSGFEKLDFLDEFFSSEFAVQGFFVISGFLILMSFENSKSVKKYLLKRIKRIYPAYFVVVVFFSVLLSLTGSLSFNDYFGYEWLVYLISNLVFLGFLEPTLPGVFTDNVVPYVNGSLWTIKIEVMFYLIVPGLYFLMKCFGRIKTLFILFLLSLVYCILIYKADSFLGRYSEILARQLPGQLRYFLVGMLCYVCLDVMLKRKLLVSLLTVALFFLSYYSDLVFRPFAVGGLIWMAVFCCKRINISRYGDFSYGIYILHFPIVQSLLLWGGFSSHPYLFLILTLTIVFFLSFILWHLWEKKFLNSSNHYVDTK